MIDSIFSKLTFISYHFFVAFKIVFHFVLVSAKIMAICMTLSWINLLFSGLSIYGIVTKTPTLILLWLFVSASTYVAFLIAEMLAFCGAIPELQISYKVLCKYYKLSTSIWQLNTQISVTWLPKTGLAIGWSVGYIVEGTLYYYI